MAAFQEGRLVSHYIDRKFKNKDYSYYSMPLHEVTGYASTIYTLVAYNYMLTLSPGFFIWVHITGIDAVKVPRASFFLTKPRNTKLRILGETLVWSSQYKKESKAQG